MIKLDNTLQPLDADLTAYAASPTAAILANMPDALSGVGSPNGGYFESSFAGANNDFYLDLAVDGLTEVRILATASPNPTVSGASRSGSILTFNIGSPGGNVAGVATATQLLAISFALVSGESKGLVAGNDGSGNVVPGIYPVSMSAASFIGQKYHDITDPEAVIEWFWNGTNWQLSSGTMTAPLALAITTVPTSDTSTRATGTIIFTGVPTAGQTILIGGVTYFLAPLTTPATTTDVSAPFPTANENTWAAMVAYRINNWVGGGSDNNVTAVAALGVITLTAKASGTAGNAITLTETASNVAVSGSTLSGGTAGTPVTPTPTVIGQAAIVSHSDSTKTEWAAVSLTQWLPRTAGIVKHANGSWYRQTLASDGTAEYELLPNQ